MLANAASLLHIVFFFYYFPINYNAHYSEEHSFNCIVKCTQCVSFNTNKFDTQNNHVCLLKFFIVCESSASLYEPNTVKPV